MTVTLLAEQYLEFLSLKGGCIGSSESTLVKMPHCWKSHVTAQICFHCSPKSMQHVWWWIEMEVEVGNSNLSPKARHSIISWHAGYFFMILVLKKSFRNRMGPKLNTCISRRKKI